MAFESAARHQSFTRAARELSVAQPAVTRHIANLENWVGTQLFVRRGNRIELTQGGKNLSELSTALFDRLELGVRDVTRDRDGELVIGASFGVAHLWLMPKIGQMRFASQANINLVTSDDYDDFEDGAVDFSIRFGNGEFGKNCADLLFEERCQIITTPSFLEKHPEFDPDDLPNTIDPSYLLDHGDPYSVGWMDWSTWHALTGMQLVDRQALKQVQSYPTMLDMVFAGEGISIGTIGIEDELVIDGKLVRVGKTVSREKYGYYLVYMEECKRKASFDRLRSFLLDDPVS